MFLFKVFSLGFFVGALIYLVIMRYIVGITSTSALITAIIVGLVAGTIALYLTKKKMDNKNV